MRNADGAKSLDREFYIDASLFEQEREKLFFKNWMMVGRTSDLFAGTMPTQTAMRAIEFMGLPLVLMRTEYGQFRGYHNICRHRGAVMVSSSDGCVDKGTITCPYHAWRYDSRGRLIGAPNMSDVESFDRADYGLVEVYVAEKGGFLFVNLTEQCESVDLWLQPLERHFFMWSLADLVTAGEIQYDLPANWKLLFENYNECYHCPVIHPALNRLTPYRSADNDLTEGPILGGPMIFADGIETMSHDGVRVADLLPNLNSIEQRRVYYFTVFPTFFLSLHPDFVMVHRIEAVSCQRTRVVCQFLFHPQSASQAAFDPRPVVEFWDLTNVQDWEVCQRVQLGLNSPYFKTGPLANLESVVAAFDRYYLSALGRYQH